MNYLFKFGAFIPVSLMMLIVSAHPAIAGQPPPTTYPIEAAFGFEESTGGAPKIFVNTMRLFTFLRFPSLGLTVVSNNQGHKQIGERVEAVMARYRKLPDTDVYLSSRFTNASVDVTNPLIKHGLTFPNSRGGYTISSNLALQAFTSSSLGTNARLAIVVVVNRKTSPNCDEAIKAGKFVKHSNSAVYYYMTGTNAQGQPTAQSIQLNGLIQLEEPIKIGIDGRKTDLKLLVYGTNEFSECE